MRRWKERKEIEKLEERHLKWILNVDCRTPGYMIREELQRKELKRKTGISTSKYKEKLREGKGNKITRRCEEEIRKKADKKEVEERREGRKFLKDREIESKEMEKGKNGEGDWFDRMLKKEKCKERKDRKQLEVQNVTTGING